MFIIAYEYSERFVLPVVRLYNAVVGYTSGCTSVYYTLQPVVQPAVRRVARRVVKCRVGCAAFATAVSSTTDQSFDLCQFRDDILPLGARIHSSQLKILTRTYVDLGGYIFYAGGSIAGVSCGRRWPRLLLLP